MKGISSIQVINLNRRPDRWARFTQEADRVGLRSFVRFEALDGLDLSFDKEISQVISRNNDFGWRRGVVGCALSHVRIWKEIVAKQNAWTLILEDDVLFTPKNLVTWWDKEIAPFFSLLEHWDLLYVGGCDQAGLKLNSCYGNPISNSQFWQVGSEPWHLGTYSYALSLSGAVRLLKLLENEPMNRAVDWWLIDRFSQLKVALLKPFVAYFDVAVESDVFRDRISIMGAPEV